MSVPPDQAEAVEPLLPAVEPQLTVPEAPAKHAWRLGSWSSIAIGPVMAVALLAAACGLTEESPPTPTPAPNADNLLSNGGFESGRDPWIAPEGGGAFTLSDGVARTGAWSARVTLDAGVSAEGTAGALQQLRPTFPELISGYYLVDSSQPAGDAQSIEFVVAVRGGDFGDDRPVHELRFVLAGLQKAPENSGAGFQFLNRGEPPRGEWTYFAYPVNEAFQRIFGRVPVVWEGIDVRFEVRGTRDAAVGETRGVVYFDDLYAGPLIANPNRIDD